MKTEESQQTVKNEDILPANKELLEKLLSGELLDGVSPRSSMVENVNGMLKFASKSALEDYLAGVDAVLENWDYTDAFIYDDSPKEVDYLGDPALNAIDESLNFNSLGAYYELQDFLDHVNYKKNVGIYLSDPELQIILNENYEVQIGNEIFKYISDATYAKISNADMTALNKVRNNGFFAFDEKVSYWNNWTGNEIDTVDDRSGSCLLTFIVEENIEGDYRMVRIKANLFSLSDAIKTICPAAIFTVNWGDGFEETIFGSDINHTYNVDIDDGCEPKKITVTAVLVTGSCGECKIGKQYSANKTIQLCNIQTPCYRNLHVRDEKNGIVYEFEYDGREYRIEGEIGQKTFNTDIFTKRKMWTKTTLYKKRNSGKWRKSKPPSNLGTEVYGYYYTNECSTQSSYFQKIEWKSKKSITAKYFPNQPFGTRKEGQYIVRGHFMCHVNATDIEAIWEEPLWKD
ncbi:MAG: hypothetical protein GY705_17515 [Bacteroidetes bacterium]|nr:hypothetical protein [Bacteroidota bacterium]